MIGYLVDDCPVKTGRPDVLATVYKKDDSTMIALASWADGPARVDLKIDWESLAINFVMVFSPNTLEGAPHRLVTTLELPEGTDPKREAEIIQALA